MPLIPRVSDLLLGYASYIVRAPRAVGEAAPRAVGEAALQAVGEAALKATWKNSFSRWP
jgi:hypothetical protein